MATVEAFGVFSGGGVRGAALAGALHAAEDVGYQFVGFGGTSAGALVAAMACIGCNGQEIRGAMLSTGPAALNKLFIEDQHSAQDLLDAIDTLKESKGPLRGAVRFWGLSKPQKAALERVRVRFGMLSGTGLKAALAEMLSAKLSITKDEAQKIGFTDFVEKAGRPLKVVASDIWSGKPIVFSRQTTPDFCVIDALAASAAFPFAFCPIEPADGQYDTAHLVDGGLASNTPAFLFYDEWTLGRTPTIVFQLVESNSKLDDFGDYIGALVRTSVNASDQIIGGMLPFVQTVDIGGLDGIGVIAPSLSDKKIKQAFDVGEEQAKSSLSSFVQLRRAQGKLPQGVTDFARRYGDPDVFDTALASFRMQLALNMQTNGAPLSGADDLRVAVFLPIRNHVDVTDLTRTSWAIGFEFGFGAALDRDIQFSLGRGCVGRSVETGQPTFDDTLARRENPELTGLTAEQMETVPQDRRSVLAAPIRAYNVDSELSADRRPIVAVLTVDSSLVLRETTWVGGFVGFPEGSGRDAEYRVDDGTRRIVESYARLVSRLLSA